MLKPKPPPIPPPTPEELRLGRDFVDGLLEVPGGSFGNRIARSFAFFVTGASTFAILAGKDERIIGGVCNTNQTFVVSTTQETIASLTSGTPRTLAQVLLWVVGSVGVTVLTDGIPLNEGQVYYLSTASGASGYGQVWITSPAPQIGSQ